MLFTDNKYNTLGRKIAAKFIPKIHSVSQRLPKENAKSTLASIKRIPPLIPAKSQKEVNVISKYFKKKQPEMQTPRIGCNQNQEDVSVYRSKKDQPNQ